MDPALQPLVRKLADVRLLVTGRDEQSGVETVEVAHEALIRGWGELKSWLNSDREFLLWRQRLRTLVANWVASKQDEGALLRGVLLTEAEPWRKARVGDLSEQEQAFISESRTVAEREARERDAARQRELDLERRRAEADRQRVLWLSIAFFVAVLVAGIAIYFYFDAQAQRDSAEANADLANQQLTRLEGLRLYQAAEQLKLIGDVDKAIDAYTKAAAADSTLNINLPEQEKDVRRQAAILLVREGEQLARKGDAVGAATNYQAALDLNPPSDTPVYVRVPAGEFTMGSTGAEQYSEDNEKPQHPVAVDEFWVLRTEVTNAQYQECVAAKAKDEANGCTPPSNSYWNKAALARWPVTHVSWHQARQYATWKGGRLPTEAEWEKACRGPDARIYPWGDDLPTRALANFNSNEVTVTDVGNYEAGQSPYGLLDMAGNAWEWTSSQVQAYPYQADDGREAETGDTPRSLRGGSFNYFEDFVRCASRYSDYPLYRAIDVGFRVVAPGF